MGKGYTVLQFGLLGLVTGTLKVVEFIWNQKIMKYGNGFR